MKSGYCSTSDGHCIAIKIKNVKKTNKQKNRAAVPVLVGLPESADLRWEIHTVIAAPLWTNFSTPPLLALQNTNFAGLLNKELSEILQMLVVMVTNMNYSISLIPRPGNNNRQLQCINYLGGIFWIPLDSGCHGQ